MTPQHKLEHSGLGGSSPAGSGGSPSKLKKKSQTPTEGQKAQPHPSRSGSRSGGKRTRFLGDSLAWLFRTNLPERRGTPLESASKREWFGLGDVLRVIANPSDTLNQLSETRKALRKAQRDIRLRASISSWYIPPDVYFFPSLPHAPGLQYSTSTSTPLLQRRPELSALNNILSSTPTFTVLTGPASVGKTSLLREVLQDEERYFTLWLDLKLVGREGMEGLLLSMASALEMFLEEIEHAAEEVDEYCDDQGFEKLLRAAKHERRFLSHFRHGSSHPGPIPDSSPNTEPEISSNDVARLIQLYRSALLMYWSSPLCHSRQTSEAPPASDHALSQPGLEAEQEDEVAPPNRETDADAGAVSAAERSEQPSHQGQEQEREKEKDQIKPSTSKPEKSEKSEKWKSYSQIFHFNKNFSRSHVVVQSSTGHDDSEEETKVDHHSSGHTNEGSGGSGGGEASHTQATTNSDATKVNTNKEIREVKNTVGFVTPPNEGEKSGARVNASSGDDEKTRAPQGMRREASISVHNLARVRMPVIVFDDAHRLHALATSISPSSSSHPKLLQSVRTLFDGLLVLSNQDKLCQVVHTSNSGLYVNWLHDLNPGTPGGEFKIVTVGDPNKSQMREYFMKSLVPSIPPSLRAQLKLGEGEEDEDEDDTKEELFERLYEAFGGRLTHWTDFMGDWVNAGGDLPVERSTPFLHAYTTLNFMLLRASEAEAAEAEAEAAAIERDNEQISLDDRDARNLRRKRTHKRNRPRSRSRVRSQGAAFHPGHRGMKSSATLVAGVGLIGEASSHGHGDAALGNGNVAEKDEKPPFTTMQLLDLLYHFTTPPAPPPPSTLTSSSRPRDTRGGYDRSQSVYFSRASSYYVPRQSMKMAARPGMVRALSTRSARSGKGLVRQESREREVGVGSIPYFVLCRELGSRDAVDFLVRSGIVELRWGSTLPSSVPGEHGDDSERGPTENNREAEGEIELGPMLTSSSPVLAHAMRIILDEYGYQPAEVDMLNPDLGVGADEDADAEVDLELEKPDRVRVVDSGRDADADDADQDDDERLPGRNPEAEEEEEDLDDDERDEFVDGEEYESYPASPISPVSPSSARARARGGTGTGTGSAGGRYYARSHSRSAHGHTSGRESSGFSDDKSDYMSFIDDFSEY